MTTSADNPLLRKAFAIPFAQIGAEHVRPAVADALAEARHRQQALEDASIPRSFANTMLALEDVTDRLDWVMHVVGHLESVATTPELRAAYNDVLPEVSTLHTQLLLSPGIWEALGAFAQTPEAAALAPVRRRFLERTLRDFRREGAALGAKDKERLEQINRELSHLTTTFAENVLDETAAFDLHVTDPARLRGLPESTREATRADAEARGLPGWRLTLHEPVYVPVLTYAEDRDLRRALYEAYTTRATRGEHDNRGLLRQVIQLRREKARILGFPTFADYVLEERMAKRAETVRDFLTDLESRTRPFFERENQELDEFRREQGDAGDLAPWDVAFWSERLRQERHDFDEEALRPYFPLDGVLAGMFGLVGRLYGITVREVTPGEPGFPGVWAPDVRYYRLCDSDETLLGAFYADFHPRDTKRGGAWMGDFHTGGPRKEGFDPHLGVICANVSPPVGNRPALLTHREVETLFHEFGHLLHHCLSRVEIRSLAGTHVAWDFVELPSQIMENWCWEREALDLFAHHHDSSAPLPQELLERMLGARNFRSANAMLRQLGFATLDLDLHTHYDPDRDGEVLDYARRIQQRFAPTPLPADYGMVAGFTHLFADPVGYAAGYYSYKWAEVLEADAFTRFRREGILSPTVGRAFLDTILSRGDSEDPAVLFERFLGRGPEVEALLRRSGLVE